MHELFLLVEKPPCASRFTKFLSIYLINGISILYLVCGCNSIYTECSKWMDDFRFYVLFIRISVISGQWPGDNERLCAIEPHLRLGGFRVQGPSNSDR